MGKQRDKSLTNKMKELKKMFPDKFTVDFDQNKKTLDEMQVFQSKTQRNLAAGYLVGLSKEKVL